MKAAFRDICGNCFEHEFDENATVADACDFLASQLQISDQQIFIISPEEESNFYNNDYTIQKILNDNPEYIIFTICFSIDKNEQYKPYINPQSSDNNSKSNLNQEHQIENLIGINNIIHKSKMAIPSKEIINTMLMLKKYKLMNPIYIEYNHVTSHAPNDLQGRVKHIAQLGYQIEDCLSALRTHHYNVQQAIQSLMAINVPTNVQNNHRNVKASRQQSTPIFQ